MDNVFIGAGAGFSAAEIERAIRNPPPPPSASASASGGEVVPAEKTKVKLTAGVLADHASTCGSTRMPETLEDVESDGSVVSQLLTEASRASAKSRSNRSRGKGKMAKQMLRLKAVIEASGGTWDPDHRKKHTQEGLTQDMFDREKEQRDTDDREDLLARLYASHWAFPTEFQHIKTVPPEKILAVSTRCLKPNALGSRTCTMCNKVVDEWGSHFQNKDRQEAAAQMACFDEVLGSPLIANSPRNIDGSLFAPTLPLTQVKFREFRGDTPECLINACRERIGKSGILVRVSKNKAQVNIPLSKMKGFQLSAATYGGLHESKYIRHWSMRWCDLPETSDHRCTAIQALPEASGFWPVVELDFEDDYTWTEVVELGSDLAQLHGVPAGTKVFVCWVWVCSVWHVWWDIPTAWPVRRIIRVA